MLCLAAVALTACGKVHKPAGWDDRANPQDLSVNLDGAMVIDMAGADLTGVTDLADPCSACSINATCDTSSGSAVCTCKTGFLPAGNACNDIDECALMAANCDTNATCNNTIGAYTCTCNAGYRLKSTTSTGAPGECIQNWLHQAVIDEAVVPSDMGSIPAATANDSVAAAAGVFVGLKDKIYLGATGSSSVDCNNPTGPKPFFWHSFDTTTGKLVSAQKNIPTMTQCNAASSFGNYSAYVFSNDSDNSIYFITNYSGTSRFDATAGLWKDLTTAGSYDVSGQLDFSDSTDSLHTRAVVQFGSTAYFIGGLVGTVSYKTDTTALLLQPTLANSVAKANLPIGLAQATAISTSTGIYLIYGSRAGTPPTNDRVIFFNPTTGATGAYTPPDSTTLSSAPTTAAAPSNSNNDFGGGFPGTQVSYKDKLWFITQTFNSPETLQLWSYDPALNKFLGPVDLPSEITPQLSAARITTTGSPPNALWVGGTSGKLEIYKYNE